MPVQLAPHVPRMAPNDGVIDAAKKVLGASLVEVRENLDEIILVVRREAIVDVCRALRDTPIRRWHGGERRRRLAGRLPRWR